MMHPAPPFLHLVGPFLAAALVLSPFGLFAVRAQAPLPQKRIPPAAEEDRSLAPPVNLAPPLDLGPPASLDSLRQRDKELETLRAEQRKTLEKEAKLKREIELIGDDRRKLNQQILDTA